MWVGADLTPCRWRCTLLVVTPAPCQLPGHLLPKKAQGWSVAVGFLLPRGKGCFRVPPTLESWRGEANRDVMAEAGAGGRA